MEPDAKPLLADFVRLAEATRITGLSDDTVRAMAMRGEIKSKQVRPRAKLFYHRDDLIRIATRDAYPTA